MALFMDQAKLPPVWELLRGDTLLKSPGVSGTNLIDLAKIKDWFELGTT